MVARVLYALVLLSNGQVLAVGGARLVLDRELFCP